MDLSKKRILLTGGSGFLGQHVSDTLMNRGCRQGLLGETFGTILDNSHGSSRWATEASEFQHEPAAYNLRSHNHDLTNGQVCKALALSLQPDVIIHLAALTGGIGANRVAPADFFYQNLMMGIQLLHECWSAGATKFVGMGTICSYPRDTPVPFKESYIWNGYPEATNAPYGLAKKMLLVQSQAYRSQHGFNAIHLMPTNLYGPCDNFDLDSSHVIPALIRKFVMARENDIPSVTVWGTGNATREFLFVEDAAEAIVRATEQYDEAEPLNIGSGDEISIKELVTLIVELVEYDGLIVWDNSKPDGQPRRCLDTTKAQKYLGFQPQTSLRSGLVRTIQWFQQHIYPNLSE